LKEPHDILKHYWGYQSFRPLQEDIIRSVLSGYDTIALLPTGGGKSICFQVPALILDGLCLVISPLIALMKDQVYQLQKRGIRALALHSGMSSREIDIALDNCAYGHVKFLYISPERLQSPLFLARVEKLKISLLAVDEAHCISQWGYDFRPPYLEIGTFREEYGIQNTIAVTATATKEVREDIETKLRFKDPKTFSKSFARPNLSYSVFNLDQKDEKMLQVLKNVPGSSVVYVRSRKKTQKIADFLNRNDVAATFYHAGLNPVERQVRQDKWIKSQVRVIVATNAFGMGIDKPDVRTVIHYDLPDTLEAYYQEAGRAGRDNLKAYAVLVHDNQDIADLKKRVEQSTVSIDLVRRVYQALANRYKLAIGSGGNTSFDFNYNDFVRTFELPPIESFHALKRMEEEGLIHLSEGFYQKSKVYIEVSRDELYKFQVSHAIMDDLIKTLLRLYGGELFTEFVEIREKDIAEILKVDRKRVVQLLEQLVKYDILSYHPATSSSQIEFIMPRLDVNRLPIDEAKLEWRRKIILDKCDEMIRFTVTSDRCRTRMLQAYFDELSEEDCGLCDYCIGKKKRAEANQHGELLHRIPPDGAMIEELSDKMGFEVNIIKEIIRQLVEEGKVTIGADGKIKKRAD
jgi:ATP-dependent DNA helicase RecQ